MPNHVCLGNLEVNFTMPLVRPSDGAQGENGGNGGYEKFTRLYVVDAQPTGLQSVPWADFLEYTCRWAWGAFGPTDLKEKMTRGMHYSNRSATRRLEYSTNVVNFYGCDRNTSGQNSLGEYLLGSLTYNSEVTFTTNMDCRDFAGTLTLALLANGTSSQCLWMENTPADNNPANNFTTTLLCNANMDSNDPTLYSQRSFNFHVVCKAGGTTQDATVSCF